MADLDDFFARKDKKKSKAKPKFPGVDEIPKGDDTKIEQPEKKNTENDEQQQQQLQQQEQPVVAATEENNQQQQQQQQVEEEWKDFEEEQRKDYTGLKIGQLNINDEESSTDEEEVDSDGNVAPESNKRGGPQPWKKVIPAEEVTQIPMEPAEKPSSKVYISPALRAQQSQGISARPKTRRAAPDITNADYFPSLDAARPDKQRRQKKEPAFEEVRHGGRVQRVEGQQVAQPAGATNRFQTLDEEDS